MPVTVSLGTGPVWNDGSVESVYSKLKRIVAEEILLYIEKIRKSHIKILAFKAPYKIHTISLLDAIHQQKNALK